PAWFNTVYAKAPTDDFEPSLPDGSAVLNPSNVGWAEVPGASEYDVTLWKVENGRDVQVATATGLKMGHWDISEFVGYGETTVTYHWQVVARNGLGTAASPVYSFRVLGDDQRMGYKLLPGWNLVAVPFPVEESVGGQELFELAPQVYERLAGSFVQAVGSVPGGTGMWLFAPERQELQVWTAVEMTAAPCLPPELQKGWNLAGICGTEELLVDCVAEGITAIWQWNGTRLEPVVIEDGVALLEPYVGYWLQME
ncbi:MAG: hypothetical protein J6Y80_00185, partial [Victivallales bacterium]|nr:hypothetical protein [Victivallales bacterium]